jgi:hypothetical protein
MMKIRVFVPLFLVSQSFQLVIAGAILAWLVAPAWGFLTFGGVLGMAAFGGAAIIAAWENNE